MDREWKGRNGWHTLLWVLGIGAVATGGAAVAISLAVALLLLGPLVFWLAWDVLEFGSAVGLPELGFWATVLATAFLTFGWFGRMVITAVVFLVDPGWLAAAAEVHWPEPTLRNFLAIGLLAALAAHHGSERHSPKRRGSGECRERARSERPVMIDL
jgi:hypothetical protein